MTVMSEFNEIKKQTDKLQEMVEYGESDYAKTHSNCCDAKMLNGICLECKEHTVPQSE